MLKDPTSFRL